MIFIDISKSANKMSTAMVEHKEYTATSVRLNQNQKRFLNHGEIMVLIEAVKQNPDFSERDLLDFYLGLEE